MKKVLFPVVLLCVATCGFAQQKTVKAAKKAASSQTSPDFAKAEQLIQEAMVNPETKDDPETWNVAGFIQRRKLEEETKKIVIPNTPYDTLGYYNSVLKMCNYFFKCDELAQIPDEKGKIKNKYRKNNASTMVQERRNLFDGGVTYFNAGLQKSRMGDEAGAVADNQMAVSFWSVYLDMASNPMFEEKDQQAMKSDSLFAVAAYYTGVAAKSAKDYASVLKYAPLAEDNVDLGKYAMEDIALAYKEQGDTAQWVNTLQEGMQKYPDNSTFFAQLIDYYSSHNKYTEALRFTDDMLAKDPSNAFFWYVKGYVYHNMEQYDKAIEAYKKAIEVKPDYAEVYSNLGLVYCAQAQDYSNKATIDVNDPNYQKDQDKIRSYYELAKPCYEKARELKPDQKDLWLNGLYRVYYSLNMGPEFKEIEDMMQ